VPDSSMVCPLCGAGMMIAVQMDRQDVFDRLWLWGLTYMYNQPGKGGSYQVSATSCVGPRRAAQYVKLVEVSRAFIALASL
jgi:hypothetical protein